MEPRIWFKEDHLDFLGNKEISLSSEEFKDILLDCKSPIVTHGGMFHADEIFCVALIILIRKLVVNPKTFGNDRLNISRLDIIHSVQRVNTVAELGGENWQRESIVVDLLGGHFDHHMNPNDKPYRNTSDKYGEHKPYFASFGLLWDNIGGMFEPVLHGETMAEYNKPVNEFGLSVTRKFDEKFVIGIDMQDNYGSSAYPNPVSRIISNYNSRESNCVRSQNQLPDNFISAVIMAYEILQNEISAIQNEIIGILMVLKTGINIIDSGVAVFKNDDPSIPKQAIEEICVELVEGCKVGCMVTYMTTPSKRNDTFYVSTCNGWKFHDDVKLSKPEGMDFFHPAGFLITFDSFPNAEKFIQSLKICSTEPRILYTGPIV